MSRYDKFGNYLDSQNESFSITFEKVEEIIGEKLPDSAYNYPEWWSNNDSHPLMGIVLSKSWKSKDCNLEKQEIQFYKTVESEKFYFVEKDFESFTGIKEDHASLWSKFNVLLTELKNNLGDSFKDSTPKIGNYWKQNVTPAFYYDYQWLGFDRPNTSGNEIFQVSLNGSDSLSIMIWINKKNKLKKSISKQINDNQERFSKLVKTLPPHYYIGIQYGDEEDTGIQIIDGISDKFIESIKNSLDKKDCHFYISREYSKNEAIESGTKIVDEISNIFDTLVPISDFLLNSNIERSMSPLLRFLKEEMNMKANYQPIVLKALLEAGTENHFSASLDEIKEKIKILNFDRKNYTISEAINRVSDALSKHVTFSDTVSLHPDSIFSADISECLKICGQEIAKWHIEELINKENQNYFIQAGEDGKYFEEFRKNNYVAIDYLDEDNPIGDYDLSEMTKDEIINKNNSKKGSQEFYSISNIKKGDIIAVVIGIRSVEEFAIATSNYYFEPTENKNKHRVDVEYLNFGTTEIGSIQKGIIRDKDGKIKDFFSQEKLDYFLLRHSQRDKQKQIWIDDIGKKYHVGRYEDGRMGHNVQKLLDAKVGTKAVWWSDTINGIQYILGYGTIKSFETLTADKDWNVVFDDFVIFEGDEKTTGIIGKEVSDSILNQIHVLEKESKLNWQQSINTIPKKLYQEMTSNEFVTNEEQNDPELERLYKILERKKQIIFYGPPGTGKTFSADKLKKYILSKNHSKLSSKNPFTPLSINSQNWIYVTSPEHWEILKSKKVWGSIAKPENIKEKIHPGDKIIFYVKGTKTFKGCFEIEGDWYKSQQGIWTDESTVDYKSQIDLKELEYFDVDINILKETESYKSKVEKGWPENKIISLMLRSTNGYPANNASAISEADYKKISSNISPTTSIIIQDQNFSKNITFHQSYSYEDFVEGIRPVITDTDKIIYKPIDGIFKEICESAKLDSQNKYVLTIDEINRGNVSKIFGELITLIESDKRKEEYQVTLPYTKKLFWIPENLFIIGTMNTADRSIAQLDTALRRRFAFEELMPNSELLEPQKIDGISLKDLLDELNSRIRSEGVQFRDKQIGHSYFMKIKNIEDLRITFAVEIVPLLQDYFYQNYKKLEEKILNSDFIDSTKDEIKDKWKNDDKTFKNAIIRILKSD